MERTRPIIALLYDYDKTLCTQDMQNYGFIPSLGMAPEDFWRLANAFGWHEKMDGILAYMYTMIVQCREKGVPFLGICLGMQMAVVEFARHVCGMADAHSSEFSRTTAHPVIDLMACQRGITDKGGTMRLGAYPCRLTGRESWAFAAYGTQEISERHRHRYEFNNDFREAVAGAGLVLAGLSPDGQLVEMVELPGHPWFVGVQFHPELKSRPNRAHPLFREFIAAARRYKG